jgi:tetrahydromethanopterin:alpha-L-glutamate ligase
MPKPFAEPLKSMSGRGLNCCRWRRMSFDFFRKTLLIQRCILTSRKGNWRDYGHVLWIMIAESSLCSWPIQRQGTKPFCSFQWELTKRFIKRHKDSAKEDGKEIRYPPYVTTSTSSSVDGGSNPSVQQKSLFHFAAIGCPVLRDVQGNQDISARQLLPMQIGIVVSDRNDWTAQALMASFINKGVDAFFLDFSELVACIGKDLSFQSNRIDLLNLDALVVRDLGRRGAIDVSFRFETLQALAERGISVINPPEAIARAANKFAASRALFQSGVPTPKTTATTSLKEAQKALHDLGKAVSKPLFGYKGRDIILLENDNEADQIRLKSIIETQGLVYLQEFIASDTPRDIRAFVVDEHILGAIFRVAPPGQWISNLARGGHAQPCPITEELKELATKASRAVGTSYCGVDLLETADGLKVIEVNGTPSGKGIFEALGVNVTEAIADHVIDLKGSREI